MLRKVSIIALTAVLLAGCGEDEGEEGGETETGQSSQSETGTASVDEGGAGGSESAAAGDGMSGGAAGGSTGGGSGAADGSTASADAGGAAGSAGSASEAGGDSSTSSFAEGEQSGSAGEQSDGSVAASAEGDGSMSGDGSGEQVSTSTAGPESAMEAYRDWAMGTWARSGECEGGETIQLKDASLSLPGGVSCSSIDVKQASAGSGIVVDGSSCSGAEEDTVSLELTRDGEGLKMARENRSADLVSCN